MRYFIDTEFIEGFHKPLFGKRRHFIDLISIGIVAEDGRTYYAISTEFNPKDADSWVKENVIEKLPRKATSIYDSPTLRQNCLLYKDNKTIAKEIIAFCTEPYESNRKEGLVTITFPGNPEFYAYYADYDWVVFCSLFGRMIDLPKGFPMYCRDLKQMLDERAESRELAAQNHLKWLKDKSWLDNIKALPDFPKQENEHSALDDAKWNFELYKFLTTIR